MTVDPVVLLREAADKATPGKWSSDDEHGLIPGATPAWCVSRSKEDGSYAYDIAYTTGTNEQADCDFIAAARNNIDAVLAEVVRLRAQVEAVRQLADQVEHRMMATAKPSEIRRALEGGSDD